ncbi:hypothetical protein [Tychonema sp. BBK16]|uniref:hypothetical protein n=1 Tax=Tychonema sp. BBK16 TaxID=2699888 RepID=UPI001F301F4F|nr:hypothetical protein [Tychonema sp. BBK16]MCF6374713.1 hypothetical protein [Tychonema sp. BBK16]
MANSRTIAQQPQAAEPIELKEDSQIWDSLKCAISSSSGFQRWQLELNFESHQANVSMDQQVRSYLRETLETLAY